MGATASTSLGRLILANLLLPYNILVVLASSTRWTKYQIDRGEERAIAKKIKTFRVRPNSLDAMATMQCV